MRTTLTLDDDVAQAAQELARTTGRRLGEVVSDLVRRGLRAERNLAEENGLPVFSVAPDAEIIPADRARRLLEDEGP